MATANDDGRLAVDLDAENGRYHRQTLISWWRQERLAAARALVVGAGALGNELVKNLALAGIGTIVVIDLDVVENSNLSRCVFFRPDDESRPKAQVVCERAAELNEDITVVPVIGDVRHDLGLGDYVGFDAVLGGLDNREARLHVNQCCWKASKPWIDGAIEGLMGVMRVFVPPLSACYECTMSRRDYELLALRRPCSMLTRDDLLAGKVPTTGTSASVVAAMQAQELIKLLHADENGYAFGGRGVTFNGLNHDSYVVEYPRREICMSHDTYDLGSAERRSADEPLSALLARGRELLGDGDADAVVELEHDVVLGATCPACRRRDEIRSPVSRVTFARARCPDCSSERTLDARNTLDEPGLLELSAAELGLPPNDVVTVRVGERRQHFFVGSSVLDRSAGANA